MSFPKDLQKTLRKSNMANKFVEHIEEHLKKLFPEGHAEVICKVCGKTILEIWEEEI